MKGMRKIKRGKGFRGAVSYAINREPGDEPGQIIGGNMSSKTVKRLSAEFGASRKLRPDIEKPVWHNALRLPPGEHIPPAKLAEIADDYMARMGFTDLHQRLYVLHDDPDGQHVHIVASRVALDGAVYLGRNENLESTRHIQAMEKSHNLEITKGPTLKDGKVVMPGKKKETQRETEWALANGKRPDRLELQDLIDDALQTPCTAPEFAERLVLAGVVALPNIASTGTMNGFSFKLAESTMKPLAGSKIGDDYKWSKIQERGVDYDKSRDAAELTQLKEQFTRDAEQFAADQPRVVEPSPIDSGRNVESLGELTPSGDDRNVENFGTIATDQPGIAGPAVDDIDRDSESLGAIDYDQSGVAELAPGGSRGDSDGIGTAETDKPGVIQLTSHQIGHTESVDGIRHDDISDAKDAGNSDSAAASTDQSVAGSDISERDGNRRHEDNGRGYVTEDQDGNVSGKNSSIGLEILSTNGGEVPVLADDSNVSDQRDSGRNTGTDGLSRFRKASAAKRRAAEQRNTPAFSEKFNTGSKEKLLQDFKQINPTTYLENQGYTVKQEGRHLSVQINGDEIYRITQKPDDGRWIWCDRYENQGGDNIDLVKDIEPGIKFTDAIYKLNGGQSLQESQQQRKEPVKRQPPMMPHQGPIQRHYGREYLQSRGISQDTLNHAEKSGMLQFADGAVLFVGLDRDGKAQNVTRRAIDPAAEVQKRDFKGSDKSFPPILPGDPIKVWIVEGGTDALALHDIAIRKGQQPPTVIVSGGATVRSFFDNPEVKAIIKKAEKVTICGENEKNSAAQARADAGHQRQADRVREITGREVHGWTPPQDAGKDLAEYNAMQQSEIEKVRQPPPEQEQSHGMSR